MAEVNESLGAVGGMLGESCDARGSGCRKWPLETFCMRGGEVKWRPEADMMTRLDMQLE